MGEALHQPRLVEPTRTAQPTSGNLRWLKLTMVIYIGVAKAFTMYISTGGQPMKDLSITQKCFLCTINSKGNPPRLRVEDVASSLLTAGILELEAQGLIAPDEKKRYAIAKPWDDSLPYLEPLYQAFVSMGKPAGARNVMAHYLQITDARLKVLLASIGASLVEAGCVNELIEQDSKKPVKYAPKPEAVAQIMSGVREEVLGQSTVSEETARLAFLLLASGSLKQHFSKEERPALKARMKEINASEAVAPVVDIATKMGNLIFAIMMGVILVAFFAALLIIW